MERNRSIAEIPITGMLLLVLTSAVWGGNMVSIKFTNEGLPPVLAATLRSIVASVLMALYGRMKGERVFLPTEYLHHGIVIGCLFGLDFLFLYWGPTFTDASRSIIFLYTYPLWVALGAHFLLPGERLTTAKTIGLAAAFAGLIVVFGARSETLGPLYWVGDLMEVTAAIFWAATTIYIKRFIVDRPISHFQTLFAQLLFSVPILALGWAIFEWGVPVTPSLPVMLAFGYQAVITAFASYLLWFWLIHRYSVSKLTSFLFLVPLFGAIMSGLILGESLPVGLWIGLALVAVGIYLVNRPAPVVPRP